MSTNQDGADESLPPAPLGALELHGQLLQTPPAGTPIFKAMSLPRLLEAIDHSSLHFQRVDRYADFPRADLNDGAQAPLDRLGNQASRFLANPQFSAADYYDRCRSRTYACCFSLELSDYVWQHYGGTDIDSKVVIEFDWTALRRAMNETFESARLVDGDEALRQIFDLNYGIVEYCAWDTLRRNMQHLPNPIEYTFIKDKSFESEREFRIALSAFGGGQLSRGGLPLVLPDFLSYSLDFRRAIGGGVIRRLHIKTSAADQALHTALASREIEPLIPGSEHLFEQTQVPPPHAPTICQTNQTSSKREP